MTCRTVCDAVILYPGRIRFVLYATGLRRGRDAVRLRIDTRTLDAVSVQPHAENCGRGRTALPPPEDFPLRLYQSILAETPDEQSNYLWIDLK